MYMGPNSKTVLKFYSLKGKRRVFLLACFTALLPLRSSMDNSTTGQHNNVQNKVEFISGGLDYTVQFTIAGNNTCMEHGFF